MPARQIDHMQSCAGNSRAFLAAILWLPLALTGHAETLTGHVVKTADGDTITVLDSKRQEHRIRIASIDAPEKDQPFGAASKKHLSKIAAGKEASNLCYKRDRYQRLICIV